MAPLVTETMADDIVLLTDCLRYGLSESRDAICKLLSDRSDELVGTANISTALGEEEASSKLASIKVLSGYSTSHRGFSCSGQAVQPKDKALVISISPIVHLLKEVNAGVRKTGDFVLPVVSIECRLGNVW